MYYMSHMCSTLLGGMWGASKVALVVRNLPANAGDAGSIPVLGRSPGVGNGNPLQYSCLQNSILCTEFTVIGAGDGNPLQCSCLENPTDRGAWWATFHGAAESDRTEHTGQEACMF